ncbi:hypothetical protein EUA06_06035 [Nocardioides glacieisoli]|uniref:PepSY domain-containing protein n=1 Tax=Nocardioides glacieisoli TaxID=1168730 RepID=A0A4Q2RX17_9ACTN|nr:PepSY domain-containing protein [Nocardioides glacieisoli]RYB92505.1 hypothetical protein EUA06_06035 [Nocardioides glacieisoli]
MHRTTFGTRLATASLLAPLALGLVACGDDDTDDAQTSTSSGTSDDGGTADQGTTTLQGDVETAAQTALGEVDGTVFSVDGDPQGWDVTVVGADGIENDLELDAAATAVTRGPDQESDNDADDAAETEQLLGVSVDYLAAIEAALAEVQGTVTGVDLSEDNGTAIWEVQIDEDTPDEVTVEVDAETGDVVRTEQGD